MLHPAFRIERLRSLMQRGLQYGDGTFRPTALSPPPVLPCGMLGRPPYSTPPSVWASPYPCAVMRAWPVRWAAAAAMAATMTNGAMAMPEPVISATATPM